ncbi:histone deacetylase 6 isoform X2 [Lycorma delicatula]|uniref:histone deacetylase 6 isoform X2 n=1 Tax=Lycorma delicatula TaxID=130591 RepID=UPI003F50E4AA
MYSRPEIPSSRKGHKKMEGPSRRSERLSGQARPSPNLLAARQRARAAKKHQQVDMIVRDIYQTAQDAKDLVRGATGLIYDDRMTEHRCLWDPNYQECPERFTCIIDRCKELDLLNRCQMIAPREATEDEILRLHSQEHLERLKATDSCTDVNHLEAVSSHYDAIYIHPSTYRLSLLSVGSTIELVSSVVKGHVQNGMAIIRPPGHHAMKSEYCGYCYFNNVALAADHALNKLGLSRILIVDWDVHHGQATQQMFYSDPRVVYFSIHRYEHGSFWPNLRESEYDYIGDGDGIGYNFNIPLNKIGMSDADYMAVFHHVLLPVASEFQPELIIISSGYDAAIGCPEGQMEVSPACYAHLLSSLMGFAGGKIAVILEGGYFLKSLAEGAALTLRTLLGDPCPNFRSLNSVSDSITTSILNAIYSHRDYWKCFQLQESFSLEELEESDDEIFNRPVRHVPEIIFNFNDLKPTTYPTRDCYPIRSEQLIELFNYSLNKLISETKLLNPLHKVCLVYDPLMMTHRNEYDDSHPEKPERISAIYEIHKEYNLLDRLHILQSKAATEDELLLVHSSDHIEKMKVIEFLPESSNSNEKSWSTATKQKSYHSVYLHRQSFSCALLAAGSLLKVVDSVISGESGRGVAVIRPPGHHAEPSEPCGFCIFNNAALAAKYAITKYGLNRILLLDWDVHHGNGTQHIFEDDPQVLYISLHRYDNGNFFPGSTDAAATVVGNGRGRGFNVNIPWNKRGMGTAEYFAAFHQIVLPIAYEYNPELVIISAGFDAAVGDPLGGCNVSPEAYAHLTHWLMPLASGRLILSLEGGYNVRSISYAMTMCTKALLGDPLPLIDPGLSTCLSAINSIREVIQVHSEFWQIRRFNKALPKENVLENIKDRTNEEPHLIKIIPNPVPLVVDGFHLEPHLDNLRDDKDTNLSNHQINEFNLKEDSLDLINDFSNISLNENQNLKKDLEGLKDMTNKSDPVNKAGGSSSKSNNYKDEIMESTSGTSHSNNPQEKQTLVDYLSENIQVHCGRFINGHMVEHGEAAAHPLSLSFSDLSVWCYGCEAYIDNPILHSAKNALHISKFGTEIPWSYKTPKA